MSRGPANDQGMVVWALTGPAGAGKSAVSAILARMGAAIVDGDRLGHELLARTEIQTAICRQIGPQYLVDGLIAREQLAERVFSDAAALDALNRITHGPLGVLAAEKLAGLAAEGKHELAVFEAAVYFLLPTPPAADLVVSVLASAEVRAQRLQDRAAGRLSAAAASSRIAAQNNLSDHWQRADEIIVNDGTIAELETRLLDLWSRRGPGNEELP